MPKYVTNFNVGNENILIRDADALHNPPTNQKMIVVSDSYGLGRNATTPWTTYFESYMQEYSNMYNWSSGSMGIVRVGEDGVNAKGLMQARASQIADPANVTAVVIAMGANDIVNHSNFDVVFDELHTYINTTYPNAKIWLGFIGNVKTKSVGADIIAYMDALNLYQDAVKKYSDCKYLEGVEYIMHDARLFQSDGVHPTSAGSEAIAKGVACAFRNGSYTYRAYQYYGEPEMVVRYAIEGATAEITFQPGYSTQTTFTDRNPKLYHTVPNPMLACITANPIIGYVNGFDSNITPFPLNLTYSEGKIYFAQMNTGTRTLANNAGMYGCTIAFPTLLA